MRKCYKCTKEKEEIEFWNGCAYCKTCELEYRKEWRKNNKEKYAERRKILWRRKNSRQCKKCSEDFVGKGRDREYCSTKCKILHHIIRKRSGCWEWKGELHPNGYGYTTDYETGKRTHVHRISYTLFKGEIPLGLYVCHACDNRKCCNPDHLWVGSAKENMQDAKDKGRMEHVKLCAPKGEKNANSKIKEEDVRKIRQEIDSGKRCTVIAREYGISSTVVYYIRDRKAWKHLE